MGLSPGPGHNGGPSLDDGVSWRRHAWGRARAALLPALPVEVVRLRVARAAELGLPYRTYAGIRASTGRDVVALLFSTNALRLLRPTDAVPEDRRARLAAVARADRLALCHAPLDPARVLRLAPLDAAVPAPAPAEGWGRARDRLRALLRDRRLPGDAVLLIGETAAERDWAEAARLAGFLPGDAWFAAP